MDEKIKEFVVAATGQIQKYRMTKRENPTYAVINSNMYELLKKNFLLSFGYEAGDYFNGLKVLIDNALPDNFFRIVGE